MSHGGLLLRDKKKTSYGFKRHLVGKNKKSKRKYHRKIAKKKSILSNNVIINLSSYNLSVSEISVINKGLNFVPSHIKPSYQIINKDLLRFERKLQLFFYFNGKDNDECTSKQVLQKNSKWWPKKLHFSITRMCHDLKHEIHKALLHFKVKNNLSKTEISALRSLKRNTKIIIKKCDKGGGIAVLDSDKYLDKVYSMLNDINTYKTMNFDDSKDVKRKADHIIADLTNKGFLNNKQLHYLTDFSPRCPIFYGLPKIHKLNVPLRPIVSQINGPTCKINELVDKYLFVAEKCIPFLLQDTTDYLLLLEKYKITQPGCILCTLDVTSLYTSIPHVEGASWVCQFYEDTLCEWPRYDVGLEPVDKNTLFELIMFILNNCSFEFNGNYYAQLYGTTMGAKFSVKFANIYMHCFLRKFVHSYSGIKPDFIARLIDDCFFLWNHGIEDLQCFFTFLNSCHQSIKFEMCYSTVQVNFLDTVTSISNNTIHTTVYTKPTDKKQYLHFNSCHPSHTKRSIPFSQGIRYKRIIDNDELLASELDSLCSRFVSRGYPDDILAEAVDRCSLLTRDDILKKKNITLKKAAFDKFLKGRSFLPLIIPYHPCFDKKL